MARRATVYITLTLLTALAFGLSLWVGAGDLSDAALRDVFLSLRGARALACMLAGSALGVAGVLVQGLFRNTLAGWSGFARPVIVAFWPPIWRRAV